MHFYEVPERPLIIRVSYRKDLEARHYTHDQQNFCSPWGIAVVSSAGNLALVFVPS